MDSKPAKRRKVDHLGDIQPIPTVIHHPTTFVLEADELLKEVKLDYGKALRGVDELLHELKNTIESIAPHEPIPVSYTHLTLPTKA